MENRAKVFGPGCTRLNRKNMAPAMAEEEVAEGGAEVSEACMGREEADALTLGLGHPDTWLIDCADIQKWHGCEIGGILSESIGKTTRKDQSPERKDKPHRIDKKIQQADRGNSREKEENLKEKSLIRKTVGGSGCSSLPSTRYDEKKELSLEGCLIF